MENFAQNYSYFTVNSGNKKYNIGRLAARDDPEICNFINDLCNYTGSFFRYKQNLVELLNKILFAVKYNHNMFACSNLYPNCYISDLLLTGDGEGKICCIILEADEVNSTLNIRLDYVDEKDDRQLIT